MRSAVLLTAMLGLLQACVRDNASHCGNRSGDETCAELSASTPYCNVCVAANDGCVEQPVAEPACRGETGDTGTPSSTSTGVSEASTGPTMGSSSSSGSVDDSSDGGAGGTGQICGDGTVEGTEQCEPDVDFPEDCMSEGLGTGDLVCLPNCLFDASDCDVEPECGNNVQEAGEECDGTDTPACTDFPSMYIAGDTTCTGDCLLDRSECVPCNDGTLAELFCMNSAECCAGLTCQGALGLMTCQ